LSNQRFLKKFRDAGKRCLSNTDGNITIIFAFALVPMVLATLGVVQYSLVISAKTKLDAVADAAALQAVSSAAVLTYLSSGTTGKANATNLFNAQASLVDSVTITSLTVNVTNNAATTSAAASLAATVSYSATITSLIPGFLGANFTTLNGTSTATSSLPAYTNFYLLLDDSPSMGIGATPADITAMQNANNGCAFACHSSNAVGNPSYPGYTVPNVPGTQLRIDAMRSAVAQLISTAIAQQKVANQYKIGVYTFSNTVTTISSLNSNLAQVQTDNNNIQLPTTNTGSQIGDAVDWLNQNVVTTASGTGTQAAPYKFVFLVTDGVEDQAFNFTAGSYDTLIAPTGSWGGVPYGGVMHSSACTSLKNKGVTVAVLYTNYNPLGDSRYVSMVQPFANNIIPALQACASSGFFFQADSASDINNAMQQMFALALQQAAHLSQ
jgi:Flp pilus assembly protein TadG